MSIFHFKEFEVKQSDSAMKVGTDAMVLGALINAPSAKRALDVGCGTGVLSLMIAQKNAQVFIDAIDIDKLSVEECQYNFDKSKWSSRLKAQEGDFLNYISNEKYDLIFSNPPYYETTLENEEGRKAQARHASSLPARDFLSRVNELLDEEGSFWIIVPSENNVSWIELAKEIGISLVEHVHLFGKENGSETRSVLKFKKRTVTLKESDLTIRKSDGSYTEEYKNITVDYHGVKL